MKASMGGSSVAGTPTSYGANQKVQNKTIHLEKNPVCVSSNSFLRLHVSGESQLISTELKKF